MRKELINFIEANSPYLEHRIFSFPAPADATTPYAVLSLTRMTPRNECLGDDDLRDWEWQLAVADKRLADLERACEDVVSRLHRPGEKFQWNDYKIHFLRVTEMGEAIAQEDANSDELISGMVIKFSITSERN